MIKIKGLCLEINNSILVISDIHLGYEEALNKQGFLIPRLQFQDIVKMLQKILGKKKFRIIAVNGDLKHEFGKISDQEWRHSMLLLDLLSKHAEKIVLIRGNHDKTLGPIAEKRKSGDC
jgi:putative SbcD/Mre11-related phosphoesterase